VNCFESGLIYCCLNAGYEFPPAQVAVSDKRITVLMVTDRYLPSIGGVERHVFELSRRLVSMGMNVKIITTDMINFNTSGRVAAKSTDQILRFRSYRLLPLPQGLGYVTFGMIQALSGANLVHAHGYGRFPTFLAPVCRLMGIPFVTTPHSGWGRKSFAKSFFDAIVPKVSLNWSDVVIALSKQEIAYLRSIGVSRQVVLIPNGINLKEFETEGEGKKERGSATTELLFIGRIDIEQKGLDVAVSALSTLTTRSGMNVNLTMIGPGSQQAISKIRMLAKEHGVLGRVSFYPPPPRAELIGAMKKADILILPSRIESFPLVLLEAMAAGIPVIASRVGGVPDVLNNGELGFLVEPGRADSLADCVEHIIKNREEANFKVALASKAVAAYDWSIVAKQTYDVYMKLLEKC